MNPLDYPHDPGRLTRPEKQWLAQDRLHTDTPQPAALRSPARTLHRAADRAVQASGHLTVAIHNADATTPPQPPARLGGLRTTTITDRTGNQIATVHQTIEDVCWQWARLLTDIDQQPAEHTLDRLCLKTGIVSLHVGVAADQLAGTPPAATTAVRQATLDANTAVAVTVRLLVDGWHERRNDGADPDWLTTIADQTAVWAGQLDRLVGRVAHWLPGTLVRTCKHGCGAAAEPARRECGGCRNVNSRTRRTA